MSQTKAQLIDPVDLSIVTADLADDAVTAPKLASNAVVNASVDASAAIAGTKISPNFGSQNIVTTGNGGIGTTSVPTGFKLAVNGDLSLGETSGSDNTFIDQKQNGQLELINSGRDDNTGAIRINRMNSIGGDTTYFRDVNIYDGKGSSVMYVDGSAASVGIGTTSPNNSLDVNGGIVCSPNTDGKNTFELSTHALDEGRLEIKNVDTTTVRIRAGGASFFNGGHVGIGTSTTNANDRLTVLDPGDAFMSIRSDAAADNTRQFLDFGTGTADRSSTNLTGVIKASIHSQSGGTLKSDLIFSTNTGNSISEKLIIKDTGKVGIGTSSPDTLLHIQRSSTTGYNTASTTNDSTFLVLNSGAAGHATIQLQCLSGGTANTGQATISAFPEEASSKKTSLSFGTRDNSGNAPAERMRIDSAGRVLIGLLANAANASIDDLQVGNPNDNGQSGITIGSNDEAAIAFANNGDARAGSITYNMGSDSMIFKTDGQNTRMTIDSDGFVSSTYKPVKVVQNTNQDHTTGLRFVVTLPNTSRMFKIAGTFSFSGNGSGVIYADFGDWSDGHTVDIEGVALSFKNGATEDLDDLGNTRYQRVTPATFDAFNLECQYEIFITSKAFQNGNDTGHNAGGGRPGAFGHIRFTHSSIGASLTTFVFQDINATGTDRLQTFAWDIDGSSGNLGSGEHTYVLEEYPLT